MSGYNACNLHNAVAGGLTRETESFARVLIHHIWLSVVLTCFSTWQVYAFLAAV